MRLSCNFAIFDNEYRLLLFDIVKLDVLKMGSFYRKAYGLVNFQKTDAIYVQKVWR